MSKDNKKKRSFKMSKLLAFILAADIALTGAALINRGISKKHGVIDIPGKPTKTITVTYEPEERAPIEVVDVKDNNLKLDAGYTPQEDLIYFHWGETNGFTSSSLLDITTKIDAYQLARRLATNGEFSLVELEDGTRVYVTNKSFKVLPNSEFVVVDLSDQTLDVYNEGKVVYTTPVVTGSDETPTEIGCYPVWKKNRGFVMSGSYGTYYCDYALGLSEVTYIHDAEVHECNEAYHALVSTTSDSKTIQHGSRTSFGGEIYHENGSHKCINTTNEAAEYLYDNIDVGDLVLVKK